MPAKIQANMPVFNQELLIKFRFKELFNELGWDSPAQQQPYTVAIGGDDWLLDVVAHKKGVQVLQCRPDADGRLADYATRQKIERKITPDVREHLIVFTDQAQTRQVWQWVSRKQGETVQYREVVFNKGEAPELLTQKLSRLQFTLDEENQLNVVLVGDRVDDSAPREKVTKKFYGDFEKQRKAFAEFIDGIPLTGKDISEDQRWYTAVLIDRLMFLWFLQEKSFLDGKKDYLQSRLTEHLEAKHEVSFYKSFLAPLFFRGFAEERTAANRTSIEAAFGNVPYLNGGLFAQHQLEQRYGEALDVADAAFVKLFAFFDDWEWHLDERPLKSGNEINPDVLGYIFEKFVNQKQMGAYYTKEDITDYIGKNTIIPCLLAKVRAEHPAAFDALVWPLLQQSGDAYIYPAMLKGVDIAYPADISNGLHTETPDLLARRKPWNKRADDASSLPTEIWRETIARHQRTREVRAKLASGELRDVGDLITYNLDIRQFAQDLIERCTDVALLKSFWFALAGRLPRNNTDRFRHGLSVLDPTCGSGAFLFAALNILKPLYDATLRTLQAVRSDALIAGESPQPEKWDEVDDLLARFAAAGSERAQDYAVIKHIIVNNLYGVDIEEQATEIAKLRLFLKLVALLEPGDDIEPLPDIDFNIRHGNTLVGYATADETEKAVKGAKQGNLLFSDPWEDIRIRLDEVEVKYNNFQIQQVQRGGHVPPADKLELEDKLDELEALLNYHLAREYGINTTKPRDYEAWKLSHQPFHWYVDFYPLMAAGGFDAVIGNPPYVEYSKVRDQYKVMSYLAPFASNLYAAICHRSCTLSKPGGHIAQIVPVSLPSTDRMEAIRHFLMSRHSIHFISFGTRPGKLFDGAEQRLTIFIQTPFKTVSQLFSGGYKKWSHEERPSLFQVIDFTHTAPVNDRKAIWPKVQGQVEWEVFKKMQTFPSLVSTGKLSTGSKLFYKNTGLRYFNTVTRRSPKCKINGIATTSSRETTVSVVPEYREVVHCVLLSSTFYSYQQWTSNGRDLNPGDIELIPAPKVIDTSHLISLSSEIETDYESKARTIVMNNKKTGLVELESLTPSQSKPVLDKIDIALASSYGFNSNELDMLINMDIKYRMGQGIEDGDD
jgi:hypothetical protein